MNSLVGIVANAQQRISAWLPLCAAALSLAAAATVFAGPADRFADAKINTTPVAGGVYMLTGVGGNIGVSTGSDGVLMVDSEFASLTERIVAALADIDEGVGGMPRFVLNTHYHGDHVDGNAFFGRDGVILAHHNVRQRLMSSNMPAVGLPVITFEDGVRLHFNDNEIDVIHLPNGHTDGDAVVWFKDANVIHMGDHFFKDRFPYVDVPGGGNVDGFLANIRTVLGWLPADAKVIPGHGTLANVADLTRAADVIRDSQAAVREAVANDALDALKRDGFGRWSDWGSGFISESRWIDIVVESDRAADQ